MLVSSGGDEDWLSINGVQYNVTQNNPYSIGYAAGKYPLARLYLFPMSEKFVINGYLSRPGRRVGAVLIQNNLKNKKNYLDTTSISNMHQYMKKIVYVTERADGGITVMGLDSTQLDIDSSNSMYHRVLKTHKW